jgi:uncharacterized membrane protein
MPGSLWMPLMLAAAVSTRGIRTVSGGFSLTHIFAPWTPFPVPRARVRIRRGNVAGHSRPPQGLFGGALLIAGAFTFTPGRILTMGAPG